MAPIKRYSKDEMERYIIFVRDETCTFFVSEKSLVYTAKLFEKFHLFLHHIVTHIHEKSNGYWYLLKQLYTILLVGNKRKRQGHFEK